MFYKHIVLIVLSAAVVTMIVIVKIFFLTPPHYVGTAQLIANNNTSMISTYQQLVTSDKFAMAVNSNLVKDNLLSSDQAKSKGLINVVYTPTSPIFSISYTSTDPKVAAAGANAASAFFINNLSKYFSGNTVSTYADATVPEQANTVGLKKKITVGVIAGIIIGLVISILIEIFRPSIKDSDYLQNVLGLNNLGNVHLSSKIKRGK